MKKFIQYTELAILVAALYFTHLKLSNFQYVEAAFLISVVLIYRGISIYKSRELKKIDTANRNIIADLQERLKYELQGKEVSVNRIEQTDSIIDQSIINVDQLTPRDLAIIDKLKSGQSGKSISNETGVHVSTISRLKKQYVD